MTPAEVGRRTWKVVCALGSCTCVGRNLSFFPCLFQRFHGHANATNNEASTDVGYHMVEQLLAKSDQVRDITVCCLLGVERGPAAVDERETVIRSSLLHWIVTRSIQRLQIVPSIPCKQKIRTESFAVENGVDRPQDDRQSIGESSRANIAIVTAACADLRDLPRMFSGKQGSEPCGSSQGLLQEDDRRNRIQLQHSTSG